MKRRRLWRTLAACAGVAVLALGVTESDCSYTEPPFVSGIRTIAKTTAKVDDLQVSSTYTPNVFASGFMEYDYGGGTGNAENYSGYTDYDGIYDAENAITNADWSLSVNYTTLGTCGLLVESDVDVPVAGLKFYSNCIIGSGIIPE